MGNQIDRNEYKKYRKYHFYVSDPLVTEKKEKEKKKIEINVSGFARPRTDK